MRRFLSRVLPSANKTACLDKEVSHHLLRVVGIAPQEKVELFDGQGRGCIAFLDGVEDGLAQMAWSSDLGSTKTTFQLTLVLALTKGDAFGNALRMCTEMGADHFIPLQAHRSIPKGDKTARWTKIVNGAAAQSKRLTTPTVFTLQTWNTLWDSIPTDNDLIVLHPEGEHVAPLSSLTKDTTIFIGPEGGFSTQELAWMRERDCQHRSLGALVLKADTAAIVACSRALQ